MATSRFAILALVLLAGSAQGREAASPSACLVAGQQPEIAAAKAAVARDAGDVRANFALADAWSEAGCFGEAVQVLQAADALKPGIPQLQTRLRVARSLVGEEHFFDNLDRAEAAAKLKRDTFRCTTLADVEACAEAGRLAPADPVVMTAHADALMRANRPTEAAVLYRHAGALAPKQQDLPGKLAAAEALVPTESAPDQPAANPPRPAGKVRVAVTRPAATAGRYSNEELDDAQSH